MVEPGAAGPPVTWDFRLLGPVAVVRDGVALDLGAAKQRALLAALLLESGRVIARHRLVGLLWDDRPPSSAAANVRTYAARLRALLHDPAGAGGSRLQRRPPGFLVEVGPAELDADRFAELVERGRRALAVGRFEEAATLLGSALALWRGGVAAEDLAPGDALATRLGVLDELRVAVCEDDIDAQLALGRHSALVPRLCAAVAEHPLRERLWAQLIQARYRAGDVPGALDTFALARRTFVAELGIEPGRLLDDLHRAVLDRDEAVLGWRPTGTVTTGTGTSGTGTTGTGTAGTGISGTGTLGTVPVADQLRTQVVGRLAPPRELPPEPPRFTGRVRETAEIARVLAERRGPGNPGAAVFVHGACGSGKSALAVHAAHRVAGRFRDGQLYADLGGGAGGGVAPARVLARFLRALGAEPGPLDLDEAVARYRSALAGRAVLVVLDNAVSEAQVRPLLPAPPDSAAIVTSRRPLGALDASARITATPVTLPEAITLLSACCRAPRVLAEPVDTARLVALCGHLPLALRIAGARLAEHPDWSVADLVRRLTDERSRLDVLTAGDLSVRATLRAGYEEVCDGTDGGGAGAADARLFRMLGVMRLPAITRGSPLRCSASTSGRAARLSTGSCWRSCWSPVPTAATTCPSSSGSSRRRSAPRNRRPTGRRRCAACSRTCSAAGCPTRTCSGSAATRSAGPLRG